MHEFSIAQSIIEAAVAEAEKHNGKRICSLAVRLGKASHIEPESLEFCLKVAAKGTIAEEAKIEIKPLEITTRCRQCGSTFSVEGDRLQCSACGSENIEMLGGSEAFLESLEVD